jgi:hypothetical protein
MMILRIACHPCKVMNRDCNRISPTRPA